MLPNTPRRPEFSACRGATDADPGAREKSRYDYHKPRPSGRAKYGSWKELHRINLMLLLGGGAIIGALLYLCLTR